MSAVDLQLWRQGCVLNFGKRECVCAERRGDRAQWHQRRRLPLNEDTTNERACACEMESNLCTSDRLAGRSSYQRRVPLLIVKEADAC